MIQVTDALATERVSIGIQVMPGGDDIFARPAVVSLGVEDRKPELRSGTLGDVVNLITDAWQAHSTAVVAAPAGDEFVAEVELAGEVEAPAAVAYGYDDAF